MVNVVSSVKIIPSDTIYIPNPSLLIVSSVTTGGQAGSLIDSGVTTQIRQFTTDGASVNGELEFQKLLGRGPRKWRNALKWELYLFGDAGLISINQGNTPLEFASLRVDAGFGTAITIKKFGRLSNIKPITKALSNSRTRSSASSSISMSLSRIIRMTPSPTTS